MTAWTTHQEDILRAYSYCGAAKVQEALHKYCGAEHTIRAIEMHASRIHVSLRIYSTCPNCGAVGVRLLRLSGMCERCTEEAHVAEERAFGELLRAEAYEQENGSELDIARREYARLRQENARFRKKYKLAGKREHDASINEPCDTL